MPGATVSDIVDCRLDRENGRLVYEGEIRLNGVRYAFDLDAYTGERLAWFMETRPQAGNPGVDIGMRRARALAAAQVPGATDADITECERHTEDGVPVYEVELSYGGFKHEFTIVAATGVICKSGFEVLGWPAPPSVPPVPSMTAAPQPSTEPKPSGGSFISADRAREIALSQVPGATRQDIVKCQLEWGSGGRVYEVEIWYKGCEHDIEIDARTGVVLSHETDQDAGRPTPAPTAELGWEAARQLVLSRVPGATAANFHEFKLDRENGRLVYEGELRFGGISYEFELDAASGVFLKWETEVYAAPSSAPTGLISRDKAIQIALGAVPGAAQSNIHKCLLEYEHGVPVYEVEIRLGRYEYDLRIDARTGDILKFEQDD